MKSIRVPDLAALERKTLPWRVEDVIENFPFAVPDPEKAKEGLPLHRKLGIAENSNVLFFAGARGDWANELGKHTRVHYTDIAADVTEHARKQQPHIRSFSTMDAIQWPSEKFDYLVTFQAIPLMERLPLIMLRAIGHANGFRFMGGHIMGENHQRIWQEHYGVQVENREIPMSMFQKGHTVENRMAVLWADGNQEASEKARMDWAVIQHFKAREQTSLDKIARHLASEKILATKHQIRQSLKRIQAFCGLVDARYVKVAHVHQAE